MKINGKLSFDASVLSVIENLRVQSVTGLSETGAFNELVDIGRVAKNEKDELFYGATGSWIKIATGGNAAALQLEVDAIEAALGAAVSTGGDFQVGGFTGTFFTANAPTSFTDALNKLAFYSNANNELSELDDVTLAGLATGDFLRYNGTGTWTNTTMVISDATDVNTAGVESGDVLRWNGSNWTATTLDLTAIDNVEITSVTSGDVLYFNGTDWVNEAPGATSGVQAHDFLLDSISSLTGEGMIVMSGDTAYARVLVAPTTGLTIDNASGTGGNPTFRLTNDLLAVEALTGNGIAVRTADDTWAVRTLVAPVSGFTITDPTGQAGNPTFALAHDLAALEGLTGTGLISRTADGAAATRTIQGTAGRIDVSNGGGVAADPSLNLATITQAEGGTFLKVTIDDVGRVTANTAVVTADVTALVDNVYVNASGDTMSGNLIFPTGYHIAIASAPTADTHVPNKAYVDALTVGLSWKDAVVATTTGSNITLSGTPTMDGVSLQVGDRVLVRNQTTLHENGIYVVAAGAWTRPVDMDQADEFSSAAVFVKQGTLYQDTGWTQINEVATVGADSVEWIQFSGAEAYVWGTGLVISGKTVNVNMGAGINTLPSDEVGIHLYATGTSALILTENGTDRSQLTNAMLHLLLDTTGGLEQDAGGLRVKANSITNAMIENETFTVTGSVGSVTVALGGAFTITGDNGITTAVSTDKITVNVPTASTTVLGLASFSADTFTVTNGIVDVKSNGLLNSQLANDSITIFGSAGSDVTALGESFTITGDNGITTAVVGDVMTVNVPTASDSVLGLSRFSTDFFTVATGYVTLTATLDDLTNVSGADSAAEGTLLVKTAGDWKPTGPANFANTFSLGDIGDVGTASTGSSGYVLAVTGGVWDAKKIHHVETVTTSSQSWTVNHNLGVKYCNVTVIDSADEVIIPQSITFNSVTQLTVTFNTNVSGYVAVTGVA